MNNRLNILPLMKPYVLCFVMLFFSIAVQAQIDSRKKSIAIPAIEAEKDSTDASPLTPSKPIENNTTLGMNNPKVSPTLDMPKKEFSMFPKEEFGNPGELYSKNLKKIENEVKPEGHGLYAGLNEDANWGDYRTDSDFIEIYYRDWGAEDADVIGILIDGDFYKPRVLLTSGFQGFKLKLNKGVNKIQFLAINEGFSIPNTAEYKIIDDKRNLITGKIWPLSAGVKVTIRIIKE